MNYPDGKEIQLGDLIWINEGTQVAKVADIIDSKARATDWGLSEGERGIFVCFDLSGERVSNDLFNSEDQFEDEGIGVLSNAELELIQELLRKAIHNETSSEQCRSYALSREAVPSDQKHFEHRWIVSVLGLDSLLEKELIFSTDLSDLQEVNRGKPVTIEDCQQCPPGTKPGGPPKRRPGGGGPRK